MYGDEGVKISTVVNIRGLAKCNAAYNLILFPFPRILEEKYDNENTGRSTYV